MALVAESHPSEIIADLRRQLEDLRAKYAAVRAHQSTQAGNNGRKLTADQVAQIRELAERGETQADIGAEFGINAATVSRIVRHIYHP
ncbi:helix-turn-helix domain-containing protein [Actinocrispum wychmicini]|uniref:Helix-turn-helix protein n=1 Tax=Actinocrispum wychmicini TaxID=1213861 RepID=A0A4R2JIE3_9PSEU|nr:helix-turn-helix domain-containing protein [Actinocrispum wychmicini]TCO56766.1 helix-turn-helix protein [Actinocrispum wychmicini]